MGIVEASTLIFSPPGMAIEAMPNHPAMPRLTLLIKDPLPHIHRTAVGAGDGVDSNNSNSHHKANTHRRTIRRITTVPQQDRKVTTKAITRHIPQVGRRPSILLVHLGAEAAPGSWGSR